MNREVPFIDLAAMTREVRADVEAGWAGSFTRGGSSAARPSRSSSRPGRPTAACRTPWGWRMGPMRCNLPSVRSASAAGDEVIVPANTFVATAEAVVLAGATPRFADVSPDTLLLTPEHLEAAVTARTRAVIVVHLYGQMPDMDALCRIAAGPASRSSRMRRRRTGRPGAAPPAGSIGTAGCFSFYPGKNLGAFGDAGAVVTADADLARRIRCLRDHGRAEGSHHRHELVGTNSRLDALQAVVLTAKLARLDAWNEARRSRRRPVPGRARSAARPGWSTRRPVPGACTTSRWYGCRLGSEWSGGSPRWGSRPGSTTRSRATGRRRTGVRGRAAAGRRGGGGRDAVAADVPAHVATARWPGSATRSVRP